MELMLWLIPASIALTALAVGAFVWAVRTSQFDALDRHALDILDAPDERKGADRLTRERLRLARTLQEDERSTGARTPNKRTTSGEHR